jgi:hypothetical protein
MVGYATLECEPACCLNPMHSDLSATPVSRPGEPWGVAERRAWRQRQRVQRRYADDVLKPLLALIPRFEAVPYGELAVGIERFELLAMRNGPWCPGRPGVLVTGGVHGYETSGVMGALRFLQTQAEQLSAGVNLLVVPCVSPWSYERVQRWNADALDPNRSFLPDSPAREVAALQRLVSLWAGQFTLHIDLHETTDTDESEFRPALAARDGKPFEPGLIPDGFYLVDDAENPQPALQAAIIDAVSRVTHIAEPDHKGQIIGCPVVAPGVIRYPVKDWGLCTSVTGARYTSITEVYPDSARTNPEQCIAAQVAAVCAAVAFVSDSARR